MTAEHAPAGIAIAVFDLNGHRVATPTELARIIVESGTAHLAQWLHPGRYVALGAAGLGALGIWYTWPRRHRGIDG